MTTVDLMHKVQLIEGDFTTSEASDLVNALIKEKVNFHKIHRLSMFEGNNNCDTSFDDSRVAELLRAKDEFKAFCQEARVTGKKLKISGVLNIELID